MPGTWLLEGHREAQFFAPVIVSQKPLVGRGGTVTNVRTKPTKETAIKTAGHTTFLRKSQSSHVIKSSTGTTTTSNKKKISPCENEEISSSTSTEQRSVSFDTTTTISSSSSSSPPREKTITHEQSLTTATSTSTSDHLDAASSPSSSSSSIIAVSQETMAILKQLPGMHTIMHSINTSSFHYFLSTLTTIH